MAHTLGNYENLTAKKNGAGSRYQRVAISNMDVASSGSGEADMHPADFLETEGADKISLWVWNTDAALDARVYFYGTDIRAPTASHTAIEWVNKPYDDTNAYVTVTHGTKIHVVLQGPISRIKLRGVSTSDAISGKLNATIEAIYPN